MPQNNQTLLEKTVADQWQTLPSGLTVLVRPMPGYSSTHVIYATKFCIQFIRTKRAFTSCW